MPKDSPCGESSARSREAKMVTSHELVVASPTPERRLSLEVPALLATRRRRQPIAVRLVVYRSLERWRRVSFVEAFLHASQRTLNSHMHCRLTAHAESDGDIEAGEPPHHAQHD